jgi:tetratricopeptide (TPR) repeat protein
MRNGGRRARSGQSLRTDVTARLNEVSMRKQSESSKLWTQGLDHWTDGRLTEACAAFREAIAKAAHDDATLPEYHQALGHVLDELGEGAEALRALEESLAICRQRHNDDSSAPVVAARSFLAEHFVSVLRFREAIEVTQPSVAAGGKDAVLFHMRARALGALGERDRAREEARLAVQLAASPEQRDRIARELGDLLAGPN